jgi:hypothetical protein
MLQWEAKREYKKYISLNTGSRNFVHVIERGPWVKSGLKDFS